MPALFAYLCALCLLLGGGYGALNWLAAPEPAYIVPKRSKRSSSGHMRGKQKSQVQFASEFFGRQRRCGDFFLCRR